MAEESAPSIFTLSPGSIHTPVSGPKLRLSCVKVPAVVNNNVGRWSFSASCTCSGPSCTHCTVEISSEISLNTPSRRRRVAPSGLLQPNADGVINTGCL
jgi:hypothetical protein